MYRPNIFGKLSSSFQLDKHEFCSAVSGSRRQLSQVLRYELSSMATLSSLIVIKEADCCTIKYNQDYCRTVFKPSS